MLRGVMWKTLVFGLWVFLFVCIFLFVCLFIFSSSIHSPANCCVDKMEVMIWCSPFGSFLKVVLCT